MGKKSVIRVKKPIEKLNKDSMFLIEDSSSDESSEEEIVVVPKEKVKKPRTQKQLDATKKMIETRKRNREAKLKKAQEVPEVQEFQEPEIEDPDDKPLTMKEYKKLIASQKVEPKPLEPKPKKPRKKYEKKPKAPIPTIAKEPECLWA